MQGCGESDRGNTSMNPATTDWQTKQLGRLPGLKFIRTLRFCAVAGGPLQYTDSKTEIGPEEAHRELRISPEESDEVEAEVRRTLAFLNMLSRDKEEARSAFAGYQHEVTA